MPLSINTLDAAGATVAVATNDAVVAAVAKTAPGGGMFTATPSDTVNFAAPARTLYVKGNGTVVVVFADDSTETFTVTAAPKFVPEIPMIIKRVNATGTTATPIRGVV